MPGRLKHIDLFRIWSTIHGNGQPISGKDKPVTSDGFEGQTIHLYPIKSQQVKPLSAGYV